jgi:hypothetical protein
VALLCNPASGGRFSSTAIEIIIWVKKIVVAQAKVTLILRPGTASEKTPKWIIPPSLCEILQNASRKKSPKGKDSNRTAVNNSGLSSSLCTYLDSHQQAFMQLALTDGNAAGFFLIGHIIRSDMHAALLSRYHEHYSNKPCCKKASTCLSYILIGLKQCITNSICIAKWLIRHICSYAPCFDIVTALQGRDTYLSSSNRLFLTKNQWEK